MEHATSDLASTGALAMDMAPPPSHDYAAQQSEMSAVSTFDWFSTKMIPSLLQATAIVAVAAIGIFGSWAGTAVAAAGMLGFELTRAHFHNKADLNRELVLYHKEIAKVLGKSPSETLTVQDMRNAADEKVVGDKAIKPLQIELKHLEYRSKYNYAMGAVRAGVTIAGAIGLQGMMSQAKIALEAGKWAAVGSSAIYPLTGMLAMVTGATIGIEGIGKSYFDSHEPLSVWHELTQLQASNKKQPVTPEQVFDIVIKLDHEMAQDIEQRFGKPYGELSFRNKSRVVQASENQVHAHALAEAINNDTLPVTAIAMSACHQMDWDNKERAEREYNGGRKEPAIEHEHEHAGIQKSHVMELLAKRAAKAQGTECHTV